MKTIELQNTHKAGERAYQIEYKDIKTDTLTIDRSGYDRIVDYLWSPLYDRLYDMLYQTYFTTPR